MDLSIIVINYKTKQVTADCLRSLKQSADQLKKEVIVIDNGSADGSYQYLKNKFPWARVYSSGANLGFARGNNFGAKKAKGNYLWLLNSDTIIKPSTIKALVKLAVKHNSQIASCKLLNPDGSTQPQGGFLPRLFRLAAWMFFIDDLPLIRSLIKPYQQRQPRFFDHRQQPGWLSGTALLVKRSLYNQFNGLDKNIFMYGEDIEFCLRAAQKGIKLDYFPQPELTHLGQASGSSMGAVLGEYRGLKYVFKKHKPKWEYPLLRLLLKAGALLRIIIFGIILQDENKKQIYVQAFKLA